MEAGIGPSGNTHDNVFASLRVFCLLPLAPCCESSLGTLIVGEPVEVDGVVVEEDGVD